MTTDGIEISALSTRCTDCRLLARKVELKRSQLSVHLASRQQTHRNGGRDDEMRPVDHHRQSSVY